MPALLAYLVSIFVFLGGAYAGLNWAASPAAKDVSIRTSGVPLPQPNPKRKTEVVEAAATPPAGNPVVEAKADEKAEIAAPALTETKPDVSEPAPKAVESQKPAEPQKPAATHKPARRIGASLRHLPRQIEASASKSNAAPDRLKESTSKPQKTVQPEHQRKPVMMILRTIEFADGRREQHLLSMSQARIAEY